MSNNWWSDTLHWLVGIFHTDILGEGGGREKWGLTQHWEKVWDTVPVQGLSVISMCKSGVSGNDNKVETETNEIHKGEIVDATQGITFISLHVNTFLGTIGGMIIIMVLVACMLMICARPLGRAWQVLRTCCREAGQMDRRMSERGLDVGVTYHGTMHQQAPTVRQVTVSGQNQYGYGQHNSCLPVDNAVVNAPVAPQLSKEGGGAGH